MKVTVAFAIKEVLSDKRTCILCVYESNLLTSVMADNKVFFVDNGRV